LLKFLTKIRTKIINAKIQDEKNCSIFAPELRECFMDEKKKKIQSLRGKLTSNDTKVVLQSLEQIKEEGEAELIPDLLQVLESTTIKDIHTKVLEILNNLKSQSAANAVIQELAQIDNSEIRNNVLASCWKNGLDYSQHIDTLIDIFINAEFNNALEAFTVIENSTQNLSTETLNQSVNKIKDNLNQIKQEKKPLMMELIHLLDKRKSE
jgi:hypothetical protein